MARARRVEEENPYRAELEAYYAEEMTRLFKFWQQLNLARSPYREIVYDLHKNFMKAFKYPMTDDQMRDLVDDIRITNNALQTKTPENFQALHTRSKRVGLTKADVFIGIGYMMGLLAVAGMLIALAVLAPPVAIIGLGLGGALMLGLFSGVAGYRYDSTLFGTTFKSMVGMNSLTFSLRREHRFLEARRAHEAAHVHEEPAAEATEEATPLVPAR